jgi:hypothetical protein
MTPVLRSAAFRRSGRCGRWRRRTALSRAMGFGATEVVHLVAWGAQPRCGPRRRLRMAGLSAIDPATLQAFRSTDYRVHLPGARFTLRIGQPSPPLAALHRAHGVQRSVFITAWNPRSQQADAAANARSQQALRLALAGCSAVVLDGIGQHPDNGWPGEDSLLALGVSLADALLLGRRFGQDAVVWAGADAVPRLMLLR